MTDYFTITQHKNVKYYKYTSNTQGATDNITITQHKMTVYTINGSVVLSVNSFCYNATHQILSKNIDVGCLLFSHTT